MNKTFSKFFVLLFFTTVFIIGLLTSAIWTVYERETGAQNQATMEGTLGNFEAEIRRDLLDLLSDAVHLAFEIDLSSTAGNLTTLEENFLNIAKVRRYYDQVRLIDTNGMEVLRVQVKAGVPTLIPQEKLQNKSEEFYVPIGLSLEEGQYYITPVTLNRELGEVEKPLKPMIRIIMPVFSNNSEKPQSLLVINLNVTSLFNYLRERYPGRNVGISLIDSEGHYIVTPDRKLEWTHLLGGAKTFETSHPGLLEQMLTQEMGTLKNTESTVVFRRFPLIPADDLQFVTRSGQTGVLSHPFKDISYYYLVGETSILSFWGNFKNQPMLYFMAGLFIILSSGFFAWGGATLLVKRQSALQAISDNERFLRTVTDTMVDGLIVITPKGTVTSMNRAAEIIFGYPEKELLGKNITALMFHEMAAMHDASIERYLKTGESGILGKPARELVGKRKDGSEVNIELAISEVKDDASHYFIGSIRDVTQTRELQTRFRLLAEESRDIILLHDKDASVLYVSPAVERILGYTQEEYKNKKPFDYIHPEDLPKVLAAHEEHLWSKTPSPPIVYRMRKKTGETVWVETAVRPVLDKDGRAKNFVTAIRDVSQRVELEEQLRQSHKMEAIGQLTSGVSHEFNNILMSISGGLSMIKSDKNLKPQQKELIEMALQSSHKGAKLVKHMLSFSKKQALNLTKINVGEFVERIRPALQREVGSKTKLFFEVAAKDIVAETDPNALETAIFCVVGNAHDAMPDGGSFTIKAAIRKVGNPEAVSLGLTPGAYIEMQFIDTGAGMSEADLERAFDPFFTTKDVDEGSGLGLSMVLGFAQQSGGTADIESMPGKGTVVTLYLPKA